jgi:hypothetical protein
VFYQVFVLFASSSILLLSLTAATSAMYSIQVRVSKTYDVTLGEEAFGSWELCDSLEFPVTSMTTYSFTCSHDIVGRYVVLTKEADLGFFRIDRLRVYAEECE